MNGPDHYRRAAELLRAAETGTEPPPYPGDDLPETPKLSPATLIAAAAVHAQLAKTAAFVDASGLAQTDQLTVPASLAMPDVEGLPPEAQYIRFKGNAWHDAIHGPVNPAGEPVPPSEVRR